MKANRHKGSGRPGAEIHYATIRIKKAAEFCGDKVYKTVRFRKRYAFDIHNDIMQGLVYTGKYNGSDMHYRKQAAYWANR